MFRLLLGLWCVPVAPCFVNERTRLQRASRILFHFFNAGCDPPRLLRCLLFQPFCAPSPSIDGLPIRDSDLCYVILHSSGFRGIWVWHIKNRRSTTLKLVKSIRIILFRIRRGTIHSIQTFLTFQK